MCGAAPTLLLPPPALLAVLPSRCCSRRCQRSCRHLPAPVLLHGPEALIGLQVQSQCCSCSCAVPQVLFEDRHVQADTEATGNDGLGWSLCNPLQLRQTATGAMPTPPICSLLQCWRHSRSGRMRTLLLGR